MSNWESNENNPDLCYSCLSGMVVDLSEFML